MGLRRAKRRFEVGSALTLTSMMDLMTIILVFFLGAWATQSMDVARDPGVELPKVTSTRSPDPAIIVTISPTEILVDGIRVVSLGSVTSSIPPEELDGRLILRLRDGVGLAARSSTASDSHQVLLQCDRRVPFQVVSLVLYTLGQAGYSNFRFIVYSGAR